MVTHNPESTRHVDRIVQIRDGRITSDARRTEKSGLHGTGSTPDAAADAVVQTLVGRET